MNLICSMSDLNLTKRNPRSLQEAGNSDVTLVIMHHSTSDKKALNQYLVLI